jgi:alkanesulfonate monooxygenase SsuD/methylene tetrahydromethanopterin reductase-like flavin-dependent oxidoreductase (luciferase family)
VKYAISIPNFGPFSELDRLGRVAREAEVAGWDGFFLWDHVLFGPLPTADPWIALAVLALNTSRIRLGALVTPIPRRRPIKLARETVTLDHLSNGRLIFGAGLGNGPWEWDYLGEEPSLKVRAAMLDEGLEVLARAWSGEPFSFEGRHYRISGDPQFGGQSFFRARPLQEPRIPIWIGGEWPGRAPFRRGARWDGIVPLKRVDMVMTPDDLRQCVDYTLQHRESREPFDVVTGGFTDGRDRAKDAALMAEYEDAGLTWWIENILPNRYGWNWDWEQPWPVEAMEDRVRLGPPIR